MSPRNPNGASTIYKGKDGYWHGRVTVGVKDDGKADRRHVQRKRQADVIAKVRELERLRDKGKVPRSGPQMKVADWLTHWLDTIAATTVRYNALSAYRVAVNRHLIPGVGAHRLAKLEPEHLEALYAKMLGSGLAPGTAHQVHRTVRTALGEAERRGHVVRNVAALARPPRVEETEVEPYSVAQVKRLLTAAGERRNAARWAIALALGLRQGEALGLRWDDIDLAEGVLIVRRQRTRPRWAHGCGTPCGRKHGGRCPDRVPERTETADVKSRAGRRRIGLPDELITLLRRHKEQQATDRRVAAQLWQEGGWVFTTPTGGPLNPRTDYTEWKRLLAAAEVPDGRLHDARHTAATVLLLLGVPERAVMDIMGWSNPLMARRYQHMTRQIRKDVAGQISGLLFGPTDVN